MCPQSFELYKFGGRARGHGRFRARTAKIGFFPQFQLSVCRGGRPRGGGPHQGLFCAVRYVGRSYAGRERRAPPARCPAGRSRARSGAFCGRKVSYSLHSLQRVQNYQPPWLGQNAPKSDFGQMGKGGRFQGGATLGMVRQEVLRPRTQLGGGVRPSADIRERRWGYKSGELRGKVGTRGGYPTPWNPPATACSLPCRGPAPAGSYSAAE